MEREIKYKGKTISKLSPSGMYEFYSDKQGRFIKSDNLGYVKLAISNEMKKFAKGSNVDSENAEMVLNENKQIKHHTEELPNAIKGKHVPAWVVAKVHESASDLSDATHYMDGAKYGKGGAFSESYIAIKPHGEDTEKLEKYLSKHKFDYSKKDSEVHVVIDSNAEAKIEALRNYLRSNLWDFYVIGSYGKGGNTESGKTWLDGIEYLFC